MLEIKQGDQRPYVTMWLQQPMGTPIPNIDTATAIIFKMRESTASRLDPPIVQGPCVILDVPSAMVQYQWQPGDTQREPGVYNVEVELTIDSEPLTVPTAGFGQIQINDDLDAG